MLTWVLRVGDPVEGVPDGFVPFDGLSLTDEPVDLVDGVFLAVQRAFEGFFLASMLFLVVEFVEQYAVGGTTAAGREDGLAVPKAVDTVYDEAFTDGELAAEAR